MLDSLYPVSGGGTLKAACLNRQQLTPSAARLAVVATAALAVLDLYQVVRNYQPQFSAQGHGSAQVGKEAELRVFILAHSLNIMT